MHMNVTRIACTLVAIGLLSQSAHATPLGYEGFDIAVGTGTSSINGLAGTGGGSAVWTSSAWTGNDGSFRCNTSNSGGLSYGSLVTAPGRARGNVPPGNASTFRSFGSQPATGQYWVSVLINVPNTSEFSSVGYSLFDGSFNERNFVGKPGIANWGATSGGGNSAVDSRGTTGFLLSLYDMTASRQWHWINPDISTGTAPTLASSWTTAAGAALTPFTFDRVRIGSFSDGGPSSSFDELRLGTTFADVAPIPEPTTLSLLALAGTALLVRRK
jgi:hypothetical protein